MSQNARQLPEPSTDSGGVLDLGYAYDRNGNVSAITDFTVAGRQSRSMGYDARDRLTNVLNGPGGASIIGLGYDVRGNVINKNGNLFVFDHGNRLRTAQGTDTYRYDAQGRRVRTAGADGLLYEVYSLDGKLLWQRDEQLGLRFQHIYLGGSLVASRRMPIGETVYGTIYRHTDALGSPIAATDELGNTLQTTEHEPYGKMLNRTNDNRPGYTGHMMDKATGLVYMQQRYYDPLIPRFLSVDPITAYSNPVGAFNRYWYANNNPYRFTDPDGRRSWSKVVDMMLGRPVESSEQSRPIDDAASEIIGKETQGLRQAAGQYEIGRQAAGRVLEERVSVNAKFAASAGTGIQANKNLGGNGADTVGWVPVGEGAYAGLTVDVKIFSVQLFSGNSPFNFDIGGDFGAIGSIGGSLSINPAGQVDATISFGLGGGAYQICARSKLRS
ncbi:hypothetical protein CQ393_12145 [Stenotrophomonas sp. MYb238]|uniref:RHS repeat domain-containing protein n=1 Tax=Stenotrophomonas sp. MYb238 TaxID=2040281 RepID=UPI001291B3BA|nr:RHS repeat-associated core domain-containing protein [Stenotrophomonas sp. MYb238]MQP76641.1 hypothetical protein [Stenotrophomonas sp. MYb238]